MNSFKKIILNNEETKYIINSSGKIINTKTGHQLSTKSTDKDGYPIVSLTHKGLHYTKKVHTLVATYFIPNPKNKPEVHHKDGNIKNFNYINLVWCTKKEHFELERERVVKFTRAKGEKHGSAKFSNNEIYNIALELSSGKSRKEISEEYNISMGILHRIYHKLGWVDVTKDITFPEINNPKRDEYNDEFKSSLYRLLIQGYSPSEIITILHLPNTKKMKNYIKTFKRRKIIKDKGSTTIESENNQYYTIEII